MYARPGLIHPCISVESVGCTVRWCGNDSVYNTFSSQKHVKDGGHISKGYDWCRSSEQQIKTPHNKERSQELNDAASPVRQKEAEVLQVKEYQVCSYASKIVGGNIFRYVRESKSLRASERRLSWYQRSGKLIEGLQSSSRSLFCEPEHTFRSCEGFIGQAGGQPRLPSSLFLDNIKVLESKYPVT